MGYDDSSWPIVTPGSWGFGPGFEYEIEVPNDPVDFYARHKFRSEGGDLVLYGKIDNILVNAYLDGEEVLFDASFEAPTVTGGFTLSGPAPGEHILAFQASTYGSASSGVVGLLMGGAIYGTYAPPCRLFPADTQGSVGGSVRQFPPSASRQRSSRGVGYY